MIRFIKKSILQGKQKQIAKKFPGINIVLHPDMPSPSLGKIAELSRIVYLVSSLEPSVSSLTDVQLREKTQEYKKRIQEKDKEYEQEFRELQEAFLEVAIPEEKEKIKEKIKQVRHKVFEEVLPEAFAVVREASKRAIGLRHFDVQIAGGIVLHEGKISEMATGEGKTLVATLPATLNALLGRGVHIVTVNDYLARRDREWMGPIFEFLGLSVGVIQHEMSDEQRRAAYACDITYGTNNEFGFDYLRDNMKYSLQDLVQRPFYYAIVDEVDSILIDEARTPLIISGPAEESTDKYYRAKKIADQLRGRRITEKQEIDAKYKGEDLSKGFDYVADEKAQTIALSEEGETKAAQLWGVESLHNIETMEYRHHTIQALRAKEYFERDVDYVVKDGEVVIVDEFTGRMMPGRRWSDGLHQAVEAKEGMKIERENQTLATITFQNYFRMYEKLAGMTGTATTEAGEFKAIYQLDVVTVPTNKPLIRTHNPDCVYKTEKEKFDAVVTEIAELYDSGRPVLVGTITIEKSERLSQMLKVRGIPHQVLNAKYHEMEAQIVAQAGSFKGVTIATNMAGRGTDILLGGNPEFMARSLIKQKMKPEEPGFQEEYRLLLEKFKLEAGKEHEKVVVAGGLHVLGTERHEARRIDNQLRGRCGRQGDPGSSRFYVSFQDDLMRLFAPDWILKMLDKIDTQGEPLTAHQGHMANMITRSIATAQKRIEEHNFEIRKQLLEYDNVMNKQREVIYGKRKGILEGASLKEEALEIAGRIIEETLDLYLTDAADDASAVVNAVKPRFGLEIEESFFEGKKKEELKEALLEKIAAVYEEKERNVGTELMRHLERMVFLQVIDSKWKDHLYAMDSLREGIGLRAYGQRDPLIEYKREAFQMFGAMIASIEDEAVETVLKLQAARPERFKGVFSQERQELIHPERGSFERPPQAEPSDMRGSGQRPPAPATPSPAVSSHSKVGRNDPCPCQSGKKYKKCCGK
jgi:preprotein translocase subunit SecA